MTATCSPMPYRILPRPILLYLFAALTTLRRVSLAILSDAEAGQQPSLEAQRSLKEKRTFATLQSTPSGRGKGLEVLSLVVASLIPRSIGIRKLHCLSTLYAEHFYRAVGLESVGPDRYPVGGRGDIPGCIDDVRDRVVVDLICFAEVEFGQKSNTSMLPARIPQLGSAAAAQDVFLSIFGRQCLFEHLTNRRASRSTNLLPFRPFGSIVNASKESQRAADCECISRDGRFLRKSPWRR